MPYAELYRPHPLRGQSGTQRVLSIAPQTNDCSPVLLLIALALLGVDGCKRSKQPIGLALRTGGKKQRSCGTSASIVPEAKSPQSIDFQCSSVRITHVSQKAASDRVKGRDIVAAKVADQDGIAELSKIRSRPYDTPGRIEPIAMLEPLQQMAATVEDIHEPIARLARLHRIVSGRILLSISHIDVGPYTLNIERREVPRNPIVIK